MKRETSLKVNLILKYFLEKKVSGRVNKGTGSYMLMLLLSQHLPPTLTASAKTVCAPS